MVDFDVEEVAVAVDIDPGVVFCILSLITFPRLPVFNVMIESGL
jgi:hypothetical protein